MVEMELVKRLEITLKSLDSLTEKYRASAANLEAKFPGSPKASAERRMANCYEAAATWIREDIKAALEEE